MRSRSVTATVTQLTKFRFVNAYLVREDDGLTLVDTTMNAAGEIVAAARSLGAPIRRIALTHGHGDHVGSLDALKERLGDGVQVLVPELDAQIHAGEAFTDKKPPGQWPRLATRPDVRLQPGDRVGSLEVVAAPGHTPGHVAFLDTRDRALFAGDVFTTYGGTAVTSHFKARFPFAAMATWDKPTDVESARTLVSLAPSVLLVGHGPAVRDPQRSMEQAVAAAERRLK
ncbi:MAG TPA: MBL fold metallo-hydrolase [Gaiellaceae bacterium]|nr:MBL fold metallo-hydrolase [Gaiellaceae bacterium]